MAENFRDALRSLLNRHSCENTSDTPDFLLAGYLEACLAAYDATTIARDQWYGRKVGNGRAIHPQGTDPLGPAEFDRVVVAGRAAGTIRE